MQKSTPFGPNILWEPLHLCLRLHLCQLPLFSLALSNRQHCLGIKFYPPISSRARKINNSPCKINPIFECQPLHAGPAPFFKSRTSEPPLLTRNPATI